MKNKYEVGDKIDVDGVTYTIQQVDIPGVMYKDVGYIYHLKSDDDFCMATHRWITNCSTHIEVSNDKER